MVQNQKLELTWIGKNDEVKLETRILLGNKELSYGDDTDNIIIPHTEVKHGRDTSYLTSRFRENKERLCTK